MPVLVQGTVPVNRIMRIILRILVPGHPMQITTLRVLGLGPVLVQNAPRSKFVETFSGSGWLRQSNQFE
eukprot:6961292-Heterocapsa_arctica.AAC.1